MEDNRPYPDMPAVQWRERIANHLRFWMRVRDYRSAERLAHESGVNKGNVSRILRGDSAPGVRTLAALGLLGRFVGMLTDSRSFLSYPRHEYFRRILCRILGQWVEDGFYPEDYETLKEIVADISYRNAKKYFAFEEKTV